MKSSLIVNFTHGIPLTFGEYDPVMNLNISNSYWPPIIDMDYLNDTNSVAVSGPMMAVLIEISKVFKSSLTYIKPTFDNIDLYHKMLSDGKIDVFLLPTLPISFRNISDLYTFPLGYLNMISILSGVGWKRSRLFNFLHCFEPIVWTVLIVLFVLSASISSYMKNSCTEFLFFFSNIVNQSIKGIKFKMDYKYSINLIIWLISSTFLFYCFNVSLLSSILHEKPHIVINSLEDMAQFASEGRLKEFYVLKGESAEDYINDRKDLIGHLLRPKMKVLNIEEDEKEKWEKDLFPELSTGEYVLVSDNSFLDYYYTTKLSIYPNIHRGKNDFMGLPYFIPLSQMMSKQLKSEFNQVIIKLFETGIYDHLIKESLFLNNDALTKGLIEPDGRVGGSTDKKQLKMAHILGNFLIITFGSVLSVFIFFCEIYYELNEFTFLKNIFINSMKSDDQNKLAKHEPVIGNISMIRWQQNKTRRRFSGYLGQITVF